MLTKNSFLKIVISMHMLKQNKTKFFGKTKFQIRLDLHLLDKDKQ
jgi:hypothetical protein